VISGDPLLLDYFCNAETKLFKYRLECCYTAAFFQKQLRVGNQFLVFSDIFLLEIFSNL